MTEAVTEARREQIRRAADRPTPFHAMLWKEWRESWWLLIPTLLTPSVVVALFLSDNAPLRIWALVPMLFFCLLPGILGARLFASETAHGTAFFQLERPVERRLIWKARVLMPLIAIGVGLAVPLGLFIKFGLWRAMAGIGYVPGLMLLIFGASLLCSILLDRPATALAAGGVVTFAAVMACGMPVELLRERGVKIDFWDAAVTRGFTSATVVGTGFLVIAIGLLFLGRWTYIRQGEK